MYTGFYVSEIISLSLTTLHYTAEDITSSLLPTCQFDSTEIQYQQSTCSIFFVSKDNLNIRVALKEGCESSKFFFVYVQVRPIPFFVKCIEILRETKLVSKD